MDFFDEIIYPVIIGVYYLLGMFLIGIPLAKHSLKAWKNPAAYPRLGNILFPIMGLGDAIGARPDLGGSLAPLLLWKSVHHALYLGADGDKSPLATYILLTMIFWPVRIAYLAVTTILWFVCSLPIWTRRVILRNVDI